MIKKFHFGLIGSNIAYSRSVDIFNKIFELENIDGKAELFDLPVDEFAELFPKILSSGVDGLSVTIPFKEKVVQYLSRLDSSADELKIVNSIQITTDETVGFNTDVDGFSYPLLRYAEKLFDAKAVVFGCGGSAKAVVYSLYHQLNMTEITVVGRNMNKLDDFKKHLTSIMNDLDLTVTDDLNNKANPFDLIVNATPLGGWNYPEESPIPVSLNLTNDFIYYDLNYNSNNKVVLQFQSEGRTVIDGCRMLVAQALCSYLIWSGRKLNFDDLYNEIFGSN